MHLDTTAVQRLLHGEMDPGTESTARVHLEACSECRDRVSRARIEEEQILAALRSLDHPAPQVDVRSLIWRSRAETRVWWRAAAGIAAVAATSGILYAAPGSPLPDLIRFVTERSASGVPTPPSAAEQARPRAPAAGLTVVPTDSFTIRFEAAQESGAVRIIPTRTTNRLSVRAFGAPVSFDSEVDRVIVHNAGTSNSYEVELPASASLVSIEMGANILLFKRGPRIRSVVPPDVDGQYLVPLSRIRNTRR